MVITPCTTTPDAAIPTTTRIILPGTNISSSSHQFGKDDVPSSLVPWRENRLFQGIEDVFSIGCGLHAGVESKIVCLDFVDFVGKINHIGW